MMPVGMCVIRTAEVGGVDVLAAGAARTHGVDADVLGPDFDVDVLGLRQHRDRGRRCVDAPLVLGLGHALHAMHAGFEFHPREHALTRDARHDFLIAARIGVAGRKHLHLPAFNVGIALIHAEKVGREQRCLFAASACANLDDGALVVRGVLGQQLNLQRMFKLVHARLRCRQLFASEFRHFGLGGRVFGHLPEVVALLLRRLQRLDQGHKRIEIGEVLGELSECLLIGARRKLGLQCFPTAYQTVKFVFWNACHTVPGRMSYRALVSSRVRLAA